MKLKAAARRTVLPLFKRGREADLPGGRPEAPARAALPGLVAVEGHFQGVWAARWATAAGEAR
jgi:hypothetical protein